MKKWTVYLSNKTNVNDRKEIEVSADTYDKACQKAENKAGAQYVANVAEEKD